jgi:hypothetical protein
MSERRIAEKKCPLDRATMRSLFFTSPAALPVKNGARGGKKSILQKFGGLVQ